MDCNVPGIFVEGEIGDRHLCLVVVVFGDSKEQCEVDAAPPSYHTPCCKSRGAAELTVCVFITEVHITKLFA
jgi:hypothetical protein